jgi:MinD-like ATPase involved in chromosome partitioning or flagellar assembly
MAIHQCALPGCETTIEHVEGRPARKYCSAAHRAAGRRLRGSQDDEGIEAELEDAARVPAQSRQVGASVQGESQPAGSSGSSTPKPAPPRRPSPTPRSATASPEAADASESKASESKASESKEAELTGTAAQDAESNGTPAQGAANGAASTESGPGIAMPTQQEPHVPEGQADRVSQRQPAPEFPPPHQAPPGWSHPGQPYQGYPQQQNHWTPQGYPASWHAQEPAPGWPAGSVDQTQPSGFVVTGTAADLTEESIMRRRVDRPTSGWRGVVYAASGGRVNPGVSGAQAARSELLRRVRRQLPGAHQIAVSSLKGGVGKTTVSAVLGLTLAEYRGDRVVALDANPDAGTLADRLTGEIGVTVRQMLDNIESIDSLTAVSHYTSLAGRLQVLASEQDPAMSEAFNRDEYEQICSVLSRFFNIIITDSGTGLVHSAMEGTLALADSLVVVGSPTVDGASRASKTLDWLVAHGYAEQVTDAVVVLCCDRVSPEIDRGRVRDHFAGRCRAVAEIPYDPHLATGGRLDLTAMRDETQTAFIELAALIADEFST